MTYYELFIKAENSLNRNQITLGEYEEMVKPLNEEIRKEGHWITEYNGNGWNDFWDYACSVCGKKYERANILYKANYCPNCGAKMEENQ